MLLNCGACGGVLKAVDNACPDCGRSVAELFPRGQVRELHVPASNARLWINRVAGVLVAIYSFSVALNAIARLMIKNDAGRRVVSQAPMPYFLGVCFAAVLLMGCGVASFQLIRQDWEVFHAWRKRSSWRGRIVSNRNATIVSIPCVLVATMFALVGTLRLVDGKLKPTDNVPVSPELYELLPYLGYGTAFFFVAAVLVIRGTGRQISAEQIDAFLEARRGLRLPEPHRENASG